MAIKNKSLDSDKRKRTGATEAQKQHYANKNSPKQALKQIKFKNKLRQKSIVLIKNDIFLNYNFTIF